jgi:hypothetical protein
MAKSKSPKKLKKLKLPKRIAGVKIPKTARKGPVADFLNSSGGQVLLAEALVLAAGAFGVSQLKSSSGSAGSGDARSTIEEASARLSHACTEALKAFRAALAEDISSAGDPDVGRDASPDAAIETDVLEAEGAGVKKKRSTSQTVTATSPH